MIITYYGKQFFKVVKGDLVLAFNPVSKKSKTGISVRFGADVSLVTTNHEDYNGANQLTYKEKEPFLISGPGDYEVKEIFIKGSLSRASINKKKYINTVYSLVFDNIKIVFLGALIDTELSKEALEEINEPDILFLPIGGEECNLTSLEKIIKLSASLEPKVIIPMDYNDISLKNFIKEFGNDNVEKSDKLTIKAKDIEIKKGKAIILSIN